MSRPCSRNWAAPPLAVVNAVLLFIAMFSIIGNLTKDSCTASERYSNMPSAGMVTEISAYLGMVMLVVLVLYILILYYGKKVCGESINRLVFWVDSCSGLKYSFLGVLVAAIAVAAVSYHDSWVAEVLNPPAALSAGTEAANDSLPGPNLQEWESKVRTGLKRSNFYTLIAGTSTALVAFALQQKEMHVDIATGDF